MNSPTTNSDSDQTTNSAHVRARSLVTRLTGGPASVPFSARQLLEQHPELNDFPSCVLDLAYEEYCRSREAGQSVGATNFAGDFPGVQQSLYRVIEFDQILHEHPSLIEEVPDERWPVAGEIFCGFELLEKLGRGALSRVFLARQPDLGQRRVVVKVCVRGEREADLLGKLQHSGIASVYSIHTDIVTGLALICMPFVTRVTMHHLAERLVVLKHEGRRLNRCTARDLRELVRQVNEDGENVESHPPVSESANTDVMIPDRARFSNVIVHWSIQLAQALAAAHVGGVLHCDVKPGNVLLLPDLTVSLLDFNLAWSEEDATRLAGGTLPYMASEQLLALIPKEQWPDPEVVADVTAATDVFGLCATIWHMASGAPPFGVTVDAATRTEAATQMMDRQVRGVHVEEIRRIRRVLSGNLVRLLLEGMRLDPETRPQTAAELAVRFQKLLPRKRKKASIALATGIIAAAGLAGTWVGVETLYNHPEQTAVTVPAPLVVTPIAQARQLIEARQFSEALIVLEQENPERSEVKFLRLYCQTCALPAITCEARARIQREIQSNPEREALRSKMDEWEKLATIAECAPEALLNLAFLELEFSGLKKALEIWADAEQSGIRDCPQRERFRLIADIRAAQDRNEFTNNERLAQLKKNVLNDGSRGEALAFLVTSCLEWKGTGMKSQDEAHAFALDLIGNFRDPDFGLETAAAWTAFALLRVLGDSQIEAELSEISKDAITNRVGRLSSVLVIPLPSSFHSNGVVR